MRSHMRKIDKDALSAINFLMVSLFVISTSVRAEPNFISCDVSPANYTQNSPFGNNLKRLLESLWSNTPLSQGFNSTVFGNSTDQVYGQALCRGDVTPEVCRDCVQNASLEIMTVCSTQNAIIWHEFCQVQYSYRPFYSWDGYTGMYPDSNKDEKNISDSVGFVVVLKDFMNKLSDQAAFNPSNLMFATGKTKISTNETIYGFVQCTRDISRSDCRVCLNSEFGDLDGCCDYRQGGTVLSRNCNMRFQLYPFYNEPTVNGKPHHINEITTINRRVCCPADEEKSQSALLQELANPPSVDINQEGEFVSSQELPFMELATIKAATGNFSDRNKLGQDSQVRVCLVNTENITEFEPDKFNEILGKTFSNLSFVATSNPSNRVYATSKANVTSSMRLYSMVQCTPDLSPFDCCDCLSDAISYLSSLSKGKMVGRVLVPSCNISENSHFCPWM
ncbi:hypothetical protein HYC85_017438 [Camellia sinensis]|uniref:Gnk2-homologous domain-containing protein n=1 Tax=Camellia sinensis TaxID=4442 RepID=A0A7J7GTW7_CAMSI|nr:hypothetical protein HYC85_017438 [Camellia sinensis]